MHDAGSKNDGFKIILCGDCGVGKSNIMLRWTSGDDYQPLHTATIGAGFGSKTIRINDRPVKALIWDTAGQEKYRSITSMYYRGAHAALLVYDVTKNESFEHIESWMSDVMRSADNEEIVMTLLANKVDLVDKDGLGSAREVTVERAKKFARLHNLTFFEGSAYDNTNISEAFTSTLERVVALAPHHSSGPVLPPLTLGSGPPDRYTPQQLASGLTPRSEEAQKKGCCA